MKTFNRVVWIVALTVGCSTYRYKLTGLNFPSEEGTLENGMRVVVEPQSESGIVALNLAYNCGSGDEDPNLAGLAHIVEHMTFQSHPDGGRKLNRRLEDATLYENAYTNTDMTVYVDSFAADQLETVLELEAERMSDLGMTIREKDFNRELDVVVNELRSNYLDHPYREHWLDFIKEAYPEGHPYAHATIGSEETIRRVTLQDVRDFLKKCYSPTNATLVLTGEVDPTAALASVERAFAKISPGPAIERATPPPFERKKRKVSWKKDVPGPRVTVTWPLPAPGEKDSIALRSLSYAAGGWVYWKLVTREDLATDTFVWLEQRRHGSFLVAEAVLKKAEDADKAEKAIHDVIDLIEDFTGDDSTAARNTRQVSGRLFELEYPAARADGMNEHLQLFGDANLYYEGIEKVESVEKEDVRALAERYLRKERAMTLFLEPTGEGREFEARAASAGTHDHGDDEDEEDGPVSAPSPPPAATSGENTKQETATADPAAPEGNATKPAAPAEPVPAPKPAPESFEIPTPDVSQTDLTKANEFELDNGLRVILFKTGTMPVVEIRLLFPVGSSSDPKNRPGLGKVALSTRATKPSFFGRSDLHSIWDMGGFTRSHLENDSLSVSLSIPRWYLGPALEIFARRFRDVHTPKKGFERDIERRKAELDDDRRKPSLQASRAMRWALFGPSHPYTANGRVTEETLDRIRRGEAESWLHKVFKPRNAVLIMTGDIDVSDARRMISRNFRKWSDREASKSPSIPPSLNQPKVVLVPVKKLEQATVQIGFPAPSSKGKDYVLARLLGDVVGEKANSRLRGEEGITYGASSDYVRSLGPSYFYVRSAIDLKRAGDGLRMMLEAIEDVKKGNKIKRDFMKARKGWMYALTETALSPQSVAALIEEQEEYGLPRDSYAKQVRDLADMHPDELQHAASEILDPNRRVIVVVAPKAEGEKALKEAGLEFEIREPE